MPPDAGPADRQPPEPTHPDAAPPGPPTGPASVEVEFIGGPADGLLQAVQALDGPAGPTGVPPTYQHLTIPTPDTPPRDHRPGEQVPTSVATYRRAPALYDDGPLWWYVYCPDGQQPVQHPERPRGAGQ